MPKFNVKTIDRKTIKVDGELVSKPKTQPKAPVWFTSYMSEFKTGINNRFEKIETEISQIKGEVSQIKGEVSQIKGEVSQIKGVLKRNNLS